jgi:hypothetical protein
MAGEQAHAPADECGECGRGFIDRIGAVLHRKEEQAGLSPGLSHHFPTTPLEDVELVFTSFH